MLESTATRWGAGAIAIILIAGPIMTWWLPSAAATNIEVPPHRLSPLAFTPAEECSPLLTEIYNELGRAHRVRQVLLLQAVPDGPPHVVAAIQDSSDEEDPTHWPSPWPAVNLALSGGRLDAPLSVRGRHAGFDYVHHLVPVDDSRTRVLLVNQAAPAPAWNLPRLLLLTSGTMLLVVLMLTRS